MPVQTDMMNTTAMTTYHAFSPELETEHVRPNRMENNFSRAGVIGTSQDSDAGAVDCETNLPPLVNCQRRCQISRHWNARTYFKRSYCWRC